MTLSRRKFIAQSVALGCSAAASPLLTPVTFASTPGENRLVVIILRGAMDGLDVVQPYGDPNLAQWRPNLLAGEAAGSIDLDGFYSLNKGLADLMPLWRAGELSFAHAVSTPYRDKRSHFDGQDLLENGGGNADASLTAGEDGWLNRLLSLLPDTHVETAFAVGRQRLLLLEGAQDHSIWSPESALNLSPQAELLLNRIYASDALFAETAQMAMELSKSNEVMAMGGGRSGPTKALAQFAAEKLNEQSRIAAFSIGGWDTHANQSRGLGNALGQLSEAILTLKSGLGNNWQQTTVMAITEFGRTVAENGSQGTDHGTGGLMIMAGGALKGRKVMSDWPGLDEFDLYQNRDLMPTSDVRRYAGWVLRDMFGMPLSDLGNVVFPGVDFGDSPGIIAG